MIEALRHKKYLQFILLVIVFVALYIVLYWLIWVSKRSELLEYLTEHRRETYISGKLRRRLDRVKASASIPNRDEHLSDRDASNAVFEKLDTDKDGRVTDEELKTFLLEERVPRWLVDGLVGLLTQTQFTPEEFHERIWSFGVARRIGSGEMQQATTPRERAKAVFDQLDVNRNGIINSFEFGLLLMEWDLPPRDVERCIQKYAGDAGEISFGQFSEKLKPVWKFAYQDVIARKLHT